MKKKINKKNIINLLKLNFRISGFILKKGKLKRNPFVVINKAIKNVSPLFLLKNKKYGKRVIINPIFIVSSFTRISLGVKWIIEAAFRRNGNFYNNLFLEIVDAFNNKGAAKKKQKDLNLLVVENRNNVKFRW